MDRTIYSTGFSRECDTLSILKLNQLDPRRHTQFILLKSRARSRLRRVTPRMRRIADALHAWCHGINVRRDLVEPAGIEPATSCLQSRRSPS
jgi:hypothetical protein